MLYLSLVEEEEAFKQYSFSFERFSLSSKTQRDSLKPTLWKDYRSAYWKMELVPPWLEPLLSTAFFSVCRTHGDSARSECNMFCLDCSSSSCNGADDDDAFCFYCRSSSKHKDHQVIQIRRSSYHDVVRMSEIQKVLDTSGVQTYVINSARVLFLNERPQPKSGGSSSSKGTISHICEICGRTLLDPFRFCSLGCKLVGIKRNGDSSFIVEMKNEGGGEISSNSTTGSRSGGGGGGGGVEVKSRRRRILTSIRKDIDGGGGGGGGVPLEEELLEGRQQDMYPPPPTPPPPSSINPRRRKGIPHRAPFGS